MQLNPTEGKYATQGGTHNRSESAILKATKDLIAEHGLSRISMIEIANQSQVSRATLYNHFKDKPAVVRALIGAEVGRLVAIIEGAPSPVSALAELSTVISSDKALAKMRERDSEPLAQLLIHSQDGAYLELAQALYSKTQSKVSTSLAMRWLIGQALQPLDLDQSKAQAEQILRAQ